MSEDEYDDELPPISVNSSFTRGSQELLRMPTAEELATQRARALECELELQALRASDTEVCLHTADSSGSEGEAALAAAVTELRVQAGARVSPSSLADLLTPILSHLPQNYMPVALLEGLREATPATLAELTQDMCEAAASGQLGSRAEAAEAATAAAWLSAGCVAASARDLRRRCRRALHGVLAHAHFADPDGEATRALIDAVLGGGLDAYACLELADAASPAPAAAPLRRRLLRAALVALLGCDAGDENDEACLCAWAASAVPAAWGALGTRDAAACVRACARVVRVCARPAACAHSRRRLLAALAAAPPAAARADPARLEVLVAAQKLQLLFRQL